MTNIERKRAMESPIFLNKKRDENIKAIIFANGSTQRAYIFCEEATSLIAVSEDITTTVVIDAKHNRDVMTLDIQNEFVQTEIALDGGNIIMKIRGKSVDRILEKFP